MSGLPSSFRPHPTAGSSPCAQLAQCKAQSNHDGPAQAHEALPAAGSLSDGLQFARATVFKAIGRLADGTAMPCEISVLSGSVLLQPALADGARHEHRGLLGKAQAGALPHIHALHANPRPARLPGVPAGQALRFVTRTGSLDSYAPVKPTHARCPSDLDGSVSEMRH